MAVGQIDSLLVKSQILCMKDYFGKEKQRWCLVYMAYVLERLRTRAQNASGVLKNVLNCLRRNTRPPNSVFSQIYREKWFL